MNPLNILLGGGSQQQSSVSTPLNMNPFTSLFGGMLSQMFSRGPLSYSGPLSADMTKEQGTTLGNLAGMVAPGNSLDTYIKGVLGGDYMPGGSKGNPFLSATVNAITNPIKEQMDTAINQALPGSFMAGGQRAGSIGSSAFDNAKALAIQSAANAESSIGTQIGEHAYDTGIGQMNAAAALQPQEVQSTINTLQAQLLPTLLQEQGITNGLTAFQDNISALTGFLQTLTSAFQPVVGNQTISHGSGSSVGGSGLLGGVSGKDNGLSNILGMLSQMMPV